MDKNAFNSLSIIKKLALSMCKLVQPTKRHKIGLKSIRKSFGWALEEGLKDLLRLFDADTLHSAMLNSFKSTNQATD